MKEKKECTCGSTDWDIVSTYTTGVSVNDRTKIGRFAIFKCKKCGKTREMMLRLD